MSDLRDRVIREITVAPGWNKEDATALVDALLAEAAPAPLDGLDVERLARAVASAGVHIDVRDPLKRTEPCDSCARGVRVIASEYAPC